MHMLVCFAVLLCALCSDTVWAAPPPTTRKTLDQPAVIQGYGCAKGHAWFFGDGHLARCTVERKTAFAEISIPPGSIIALLPDGNPDFVQMSHDAPVRDFVCQGGGLLGPGEGSVVSFYSSGKLKLCFLARDQEVQGIPCSKGGFLASLHGQDPGLQFYESGKVHSCRLSRDFAGLPAGARFKQPQ
jgi:hypothetical protein